jgi:hypothetical protein
MYLTIFTTVHLIIIPPNLKSNQINFARKFINLKKDTKLVIAKPINKSINKLRRSRNRDFRARIDFLVFNSRKIKLYDAT